MSIFQSLSQSSIPRLHVFEQEGGWHWGITIPRSAGCGFKVIAYSERTFRAENEAQTDGDRALVNLAEMA
ncbi:hypothetical protein C7402_108291 [Paraburkholderia unamae]|uniref:Uncharacterized protein n=2 Tax=Paraburkholderia unamae TaxID=219649 RepID=A0ABX5KPG5_9BURK|nr:hypothetical protein [Paraburkholderia unamae]PVX82918.1 hypothetical protein C7402_108291 [Paraburkholderia unamae]RAR61146.1 hypothetical protein C7401_10882 [Paraburkholderia unamae]CAG9268941.1 conserved hypothetical protein [Paraburkholderia unamae]